MAYDLLDAQQLADRWKKSDNLTVIQKARADRNWTYGHAIIDEAQELSFMDWRMIMRRIPNKWITAVGDIAQTSHQAGSTSWAETFEPFVKNRWKLHNLTINYRTPVEVSLLANKILYEIDANMIAPLAIRDSNQHPEAKQLLPQEITDYLQERIKEHENHQQGLLAIIFANETYVISDSNPYYHPLSAVKGLEFDHVIIIEPNDFINASSLGMRDLYVAITRSTQSLTIVHSQKLPEVLAEFFTPIKHKY